MKKDLKINNAIRKSKTATGAKAKGIEEESLAERALVSPNRILETTEIETDQPIVALMMDDLQLGISEINDRTEGISDQLQLVTTNWTKLSTTSTERRRTQTSPNASSTSSSHKTQSI